MVKANKVASATNTWQAPSDTNTWQPATTQTNTWDANTDTNTWEAASSDPATSSAIDWNQNAQQQNTWSQENTWSQQNTWTEEQSTWSSQPEATNTWSAEDQNTWSSSAPAWTQSSEEAWSSSADWDQQQQDTTTQQWTNTWDDATNTEWSSSAAPSSSSTPQVKFRVANVQQQAATTTSSDNAWEATTTSDPYAITVGHPDSSSDAWSSEEPEPATSSAVTPPSTGNSYGKRGLAWAVDDRWAPTIATDKISWAYHWQDDYISTLPSSVEFYPMLYSGSQDDINKFDAAVKSMPSAPTYILGPNEPDIPSQSNMSPQEAAAVWKQHMEPYADQGAQLCTPAVAYKIDWLQQFMDACDGCRISCVAIHSYDDYDPNYATLKSRIEDTHNAFPDYDIWVVSLISCSSWL